MGTRTLDRLHHKPLKFWCSRCVPAQAFASFKAIADHYKTSHEKDDEVGICPVCEADRAVYLEQMHEPCWRGHREQKERHE